MSLVDELVDVIECETSNRAMAERIAKAVLDHLASKAGDVRGMLPSAEEASKAWWLGWRSEHVHMLWVHEAQRVLDLCAERIASVVVALRVRAEGEPDGIEHVAVTRNGVTTLLRKVDCPPSMDHVELQDYIGVKVNASRSDEPIADPVERAKAVAKILRGRGIWADDGNDGGWCVHVAGLNGSPASCDLRWGRHDICVYAAMGPCAIADAIQAQEAKRAQKWAGDV